MLSLSSRSDAALPKPAAVVPQPIVWPAPPPSVEALAAWLDTGRSGDYQVRASAIALKRQGSFATAEEEVQHLLEVGYTPRSDCRPVPIRRPVDWRMDPLQDRNWRSQLNMLRLLDPFLRAYEQTQEPELLRQAFDYCLDWARFHGAAANDHPFAWVDMVVGVRAQRLAYLCERVRAGVFATDPPERVLFAKLLADHWRRLTSKGFFKYTNHTIVDIHGLTALLRSALPHDRSRRDWEHAIGQHLDRVLDTQFDGAGVHRENSPSYHFVAKNMFVALQRSGWYARISPTLERTLRRAAAVEAWMRMPDGRLVPLGDTDGEPPRQPLAPLRCRPPTVGAPIESFNRSGYAFVRSVRDAGAGDWSFLGIKAGFEVNTHRHHDEIYYVWSESGWDIVVDAGKYSYDNDDMRRYATSARAHNVIQFDGLELNADVAHSTGHLTDAVREHPWGVTVGAQWTHRPRGILQRRTIHFSPGRWLLIVDDIIADSAVAFVHRTHLAPEFDVRHDAGRFVGRHESGAELGIHVWCSVPVGQALRRGASVPALEGWVSRGYRKKQAAPTLCLEGRAARATTIVALSLDPSAGLRTSPRQAPFWASAEGAFPIVPDAE